MLIICTEEAPANIPFLCLLHHIRLSIKDEANPFADRDFILIAFLIALKPNELEKDANVTGWWEII